MINKALVEGRVTKDIDLRKTQNGLSVCAFTVASDSGMKDKEGNKITDFVQVTAWGQNADFLSQYVTKGALVSVEGRIVQRVREIEARKVYTNEVNADKVNLLAKPKEKVERHDDFGFDTGAVNMVAEDDLPW